MLPLLEPNMRADVYVIAQQGAYVAVYFIAAALEWRWGPLKNSVFTYLASIGFIVTIPCIVAMMTNTHSNALAVIYGLGMGTGIAAGFIQWLLIIVDRPTKEIELLLFIASAFSIFSGVLIGFIPIRWRFVLFSVVLVPTTIFLLWRNTRRIGGISRTIPPKQVKGGQKRLISSLAIPIICAVVLVLVAPVASTTYISIGDQDLIRVILAQVANLTALIILALIYYGLKRKVSIFNAYCMLLPVLASSVLVASFFEPEQRWFVLFLGDICFCVVSFLMMLTSCSIAKQLNVSTTIVYGLLGGFVYLARTPEALLIVYPAHPLSGLTSFAIAALLLYVLTIPTFFLPFLRRQSERLCRVESRLTSSDLANACDVISRLHGLPQRQREVFKLLIGGHSVGHIAEALSLSENTVKTYRKTIYATLGVHSKQELLDLVHKKMDTGSQDGL